MTKSYVTLEQHVCPVCGKTFDTGSLLLDTRLRDRFERHTVTGWEMCPEHKAMSEEYVALVAIDPAKSKRDSDGNYKPGDVHPLGTVAHVRRTIWDKLFNIPAPGPLVFCDQQTIEVLQKRMQEAQGESS